MRSPPPSSNGFSILLRGGLCVAAAERRWNLHLVQRSVVNVKKVDPDLDKPAHPWHELSIRDGKLVRGVASKDKEKTKSSSPAESGYLSTPEVTIVGKKEVLVDIEGGGRTSYAFKLNTAPDPMWQHLLAVQVYDVPEGINRSDIRVELREDTLFLLCMPSNLEAKYAFLKAAVARTNQEYQREKENVTRHVKETEDEKQQQATTGKTKVQIVRERFDKLEL